MRHPDEMEALVLEYVRYIERKEGEAHDAGANLRATALLRATRERLMKELENYRLLYARMHTPVVIISRDGSWEPPCAHS